MPWWREDLSTFGLVIAFLAVVGGWLLSFTQFGANLIFFGMALAIASAALCPTRRRLMAAAVVVAGVWWMTGIALAAVFVGYEVVRAWRPPAD
ncbi:MAG TPA: hypothetical protein PLX85_05685 [Dehalococcoidia bacterium]|nr:hypothetical protein [Dehalococcoidia bacterium]